MNLASNESDGRRTVQAVDRAILILESLAGAAQGLSLGTLAKSMDLAPQTLQSLLRTLQSHQWVSQEGRGAPYRLGPAPALLHRRWMSEQNMASFAKPLVAELSRSLGEYVILAEWAGRGLLPLAEAYPDQELAVRGESPSIERLHTMATGKLLLAYLDEAQRRDLVSTLPLTALGPNSVTDEQQLLEQLEEIRQDGYVVCVEEAAEGVVAIAVPVILKGEQIRIAIGTSLPLARYSQRIRVNLFTALRKAADAIADARERGAVG